MKIFILDDSRLRQNNLFRLLNKKFDGPKIFQAYSRDEAIEMLEKHQRFDIIFLDHDLGGEVYVNSSEYNTGFWVAKYIADNKIGYGQIILHTLNFSGAVIMLNLLKNAKHIPYTILVKVLDE